MFINRLILVATFLVAIVLPGFTAMQDARGELVVFEFAGNDAQNGQDLNGISNGTTDAFGSTFYVTMSAQASDGVFFHHNKGLAINSDSGKKKDQLDGDDGLHESLDFSFAVSQPAIITFSSIKFHDMKGDGEPGDDAASLVFSGGNSYTINGANVDNDQEFFLSELYTSIQTISLSHLDGNGFRIQSITLDVSLQSVPECSALLMFGCTIAFVVITRRRRD